MPRAKKNFGKPKAKKMNKNKPQNKKPNCPDKNRRTRSTGRAPSPSPTNNDSQQTNKEAKKSPNSTIKDAKAKNEDHSGQVVINISEYKQLCQAEMEAKSLKKRLEKSYERISQTQKSNKDLREKLCNEQVKVQTLENILYQQGQMNNTRYRGQPNYIPYKNNEFNNNNGYSNNGYNNNSNRFFNRGREQARENTRYNPYNHS